MKETIKRKLSSRKFWVCICGFVTSLMTLMRYSESEAALVTSLITSAGCLIAYILSEGYVDGARLECGYADENAEYSEDL